MKTHPAVAVVGPTGSGKSDLALDIAQRFGGEIVNCDSVQLYRHLHIGTAKTPEADRRGIPHHLLDILNPDEVFTAGDYVRIARPLLLEISGRGRLPVIVGGTGLYLRALQYGLFDAPRRDEALRARLLRRKQGSPHRLLRRLDPEAAKRIHPNDLQKTIRAVEVCLLQQRPISELQPNREPMAGFHFLKLGLEPDRSALIERLNERCVRMFQAGLIEEVRHVLDTGFARTSKALESIGYREALLFLDGKLTPNQAVEMTQISTRQYAKRQLTWFRKEADIRWIHRFGNSRDAMAAALPAVEELLSKTK